MELEHCLRMLRLSSKMAIGSPVGEIRVIGEHRSLRAQSLIDTLREMYSRARLFGGLLHVEESPTALRGSPPRGAERLPSSGLATEVISLPKTHLPDARLGK